MAAESPAQAGTPASPPPGRQRLLSAEQVEAFHHDLFVEDQLRHFERLLPHGAEPLSAVDVGGGCGYFAAGLQRRGAASRARVIDMDPASVAACRRAGVEAELGDALAPPASLQADVASFNLILHHLVGADEQATTDLQCRALAAWHGRARLLFVNEYIYESLVARLAGRLIFAVTSSRALSMLARGISRWVPSLRANTFGVGVRFRAHDEWRELFAQAGWQVRDSCLGEPEPVAPTRRLLLIKTIRRDSFVLEPQGNRPS